jgi:hypothetical protein
VPPSSSRSARGWGNRGSRLPQRRAVQSASLAPVPVPAARR